MWIIESDASTSVKQKALQSFSHVLSAGAGDRCGSGNKLLNKLVFEDDEDLENEASNSNSPILVQLTPLKLVEVLAAELNLSSRRDGATNDKLDENWISQKIHIKPVISEKPVKRKHHHRLDSDTVEKSVDGNKLFEEILFIMKRVVDLVKNHDIMDRFVDDKHMQVNPFEPIAQYHCYVF